MIGAATPRKPHQRRLAPEVVQTSAMDCGPAALKCLLDGFGINVSYGRLREACQTDLDGTSIDTIETLANELGVGAEQSVLPLDQVFSLRAGTLPALVVVRKPDGAAHFVVVWSRRGETLQVMDPAIGRRWVSIRQFQSEIFRYETSIPAADWCAWARSPEFLEPLRLEIEALTRSKLAARILIDRALEDDRWFRLGALDATLRLVRALGAGGGVRPGRRTQDLIVTLFDDTVASATDIHASIPKAYWSAAPDLSNDDPNTEWLILSGAVILRLSGRLPATQGGAAAVEPAGEPITRPTYREAPVHPIATLWGLLKADGLLAPLILGGAMVLGCGAVLVQLVLFKSLLDVSLGLNLGPQRVGWLMALAAFVGVTMLLEVPIVMETQRLGRRLEMRLRIALLAKLPRLNDRYFHSRPISDMAERSHSLYQSRLAPGLGLHLVQALFSLAFTLAAMAVIDPFSLAPGLMIAAAAIFLPVVFQPLLAERDLRVRNHLGALNGVYLDAMLGLSPIRTHGAQGVVSALHEGLLTQWSRSGRRLIALSTRVSLIQAAVCTGGAGLLLYLHFLRAKGIGGGDLLLVYWTLRLPAIGGELSGLAQQYPAQRNILARLMEPLSSPETDARDARALQPCPEGPAAIQLDAALVRAGGHVILSDVTLKVAPGEHVAIVGESGAGKSTLFGLLMGWQTAGEGHVSVDGVPLAGAKLAALRQEIAWVDPMVHLWNRSFLDNLTYAVETVDHGRVAPVLEAGLLRGVLHKLPDGLQTYLGEGGARLSGGEGQRLRLARALMQPNVRLALLDEPFRGLDRSQRARLLRESRAWWCDVTLMCISHDIAETLSFDRVLVVEDGRVVEDGDPRVLKGRPSRYRALLEAEDLLNRETWAGDDWRRIVLSDGVIVADDMPEQGENVMHFASRFKAAAQGQASGQAPRGVDAGGDHGR